MTSDRIFAAAAGNTLAFLQCEQPVMGRGGALRQLSVVEGTLALLPAHAELRKRADRVQLYMATCHVDFIDDVLVTQEIIALVAEAEALLASSLVEIDAMAVLYTHAGASAAPAASQA